MYPIYLDALYSTFLYVPQIPIPIPSFSRSVVLQFYVEPDMVALFRVNITSPKKLGTFTGELEIHTSFDRVQ